MQLNYLYIFLKLEHIYIYIYFQNNAKPDLNNFFLVSNKLGYYTNKTRNYTIKKKNLFFLKFYFL
jgi:hypothetical protein